MTRRKEILRFSSSILNFPNFTVTGRIQTFSEKQTTYYLVRNREGKRENEIIDEEEDEEW